MGLRLGQMGLRLGRMGLRLGQMGLRLFMILLILPLSLETAILNKASLTIWGAKVRQFLS